MSTGAGGPSYVEPAPIPAPAYPYAEPHQYPQLLLTPTWAWWRPVVGVPLLLIGVFVLAGTLLLPVLAAAVWVESAIEGTAFGSAFGDATALDPVTPASMLWLNLVLASGSLVAFALMRWLHHLRPRWLTSVLPGLRTRFFLACLAISVVALALQVVLTALLPVAADEGGAGGSVNHLGGRTLAFAVVILLTTPLQAMGEEYVFRGYLLQAFGSLFNTWTAVLGTAVLFALFHGSQDLPLFADRLAFGLLAGYLVVRIGGLEAGIALHVVNNYVAFGFALVFGDITGALTATAGSWWSLPVTVVQSVVFVLLVTYVARRMGLTDRTAPPPARGPAQRSAQTLPGSSGPIGDHSS